MQVAIGGRQHAHVDALRHARADAFERLFLEHAQQFGLQRQFDFGDFVEQDGALIGQFEASDARGVGAGEGTAFVAEQFAFHQVAERVRDS